MILYPRLVAEFERRGGAARLAEVAGESVAVAEAWLSGGLAVPLHLRGRIAAAVRVRKGELFRLRDDIEEARADLESQGLDWHITDPTVLRAIDLPRRGAA